MVCPICKNADASAVENLESQPDNTFAIDCAQCGKFVTTGSEKERLNHIADADRWKVSAWINESKPAIVGTVEIDTALQSAVPSLHHRADRMLRYIVSKYPSGTTFYDGEVFAPLMSIGWNANSTETRFMIGSVLCNEMGLLTLIDNRYYRVSPKGLLHLEGRREAVSSVGFCAMWFNPSVRFIYDEAISKAIKDAGYEPFRVDGKEHNNRIDDEIVANIKSAKFMVADLTGHRGGVYYEAGLAHGLGLEVIFTCKEKRATHFDIRQYNTIFWNPNNMADFREKIKNRILASSIGKGPLDPNRA